MCSPETVVQNLVRVKDVPAAKFGLTRVVNLPGITVSVQQILDALVAVRGKQVLDLISEERDSKIEAIVGSWPARFDTQRAEGLGMGPDVELVQIIKSFAKRVGL